MSHLSEPDADRQLDEGSEPPPVCRVCFTQLEADDEGLCPFCDEEAALEALERYVDEEMETRWWERRQP